jgi:hypothetical protein
MSTRSIGAAAAAVAALAGTGAFVLPGVASAAPARPARPATGTHTLKFISVEQAVTQLSPKSWAFQDTDYSCAGKVLGYDVFYQVATTNSNFDGRVALAIKGGLLYASIKYNSATGTFSNGRVTGGTLAFGGDTGTVTAKVLSATATAVTVTYTT